MNDNETPKQYRQTLCWDCANATGGCSWTDHHEHTPVNGWNAIKTRIRVYNPDRLHEECSYIVQECPEFIRDAEEFGKRRIGKSAEYQDLQKKVVAAYKRGEKGIKIQKDFGITQSTIYWILRKEGIEFNRRTDKRTKGRKP